jgi:hypothetical protein
LDVFPLVGEGTPSSPVAADFDGDGVAEAVLHGNGSALLIVNSASGAPARSLEPTDRFGADSKARPDSMLPLLAQPSIGDLNQDGVPDVVTSGGSASLARDLRISRPRGEPAQHLLAMWDGKTGAMFPGSPALLEDFTFLNNQAIADLSGDGYPEVLTGSGGYYVHAIDACGREAAGFPKFTGQWVSATAAVGDVDGDSVVEVVVPSRNGWLYAWHTKARSDAVIQWESFHHDNRNSGNLATPLAQGKMLGAVEPLAIDENGSCVLQNETPGPRDARTLEAVGGCGCATPGKRRPGPVALSVTISLLALSRARRFARRLGPQKKQ